MAAPKSQLGWILLGIVLVVFVLVYVMKNRSPYTEGYGQDPSNRVSVGWLAGPMYGADFGDDPVSEYARQLAQQKDGCFNC